MNFRYKVESHGEIIEGYGNLANIRVAIKEKSLRSIPVPVISGLTKRALDGWRAVVNFGRRIAATRK